MSIYYLCIQMGISFLFAFAFVGHGNPFQYSCLKNPHGQRSLADYSPWGVTKSQT